MKDRKSLYLLIFALTVVTIAFILISIWGYHFYFQSKDTKPLSDVQNVPVIVKKTAMRDSLQTLLNSTVQEMNYEDDSTFYDSSGDTTLELKLIEFNRLRNEIAEILKNKTSSGDMSVASEKIGQLQRSLDELRNKNNEVAEENARLNKILKKLIVEKEHGNNTNKSARKKTTSTSSLPLLVSHLRFLGIGMKNDNQRVTNIASQTVKLLGSFQINVKPNNPSTSIYVEIIQPNGKTLLNSSWQSGTFETTSGRKVYSALLHFDNTKDNKNRLQFSIDSHNFQKGKYTMQIYHQGIIIGRLVRTLY
jgi:regulator of replication initiation timing